VFGALTTAVNFAVFWAATSVASIEYKSANAIAWALAVAFAYITNRLFVFRSRASGASAVAGEAARFVGARLLTLLVDMAIMVLAVELLGIGGAVAKIAANIVVIVSNYAISKLFVFRRPGGGDSGNGGAGGDGHGDGKSGDWGDGDWDGGGSYAGSGAGGGDAGGGRGDGGSYADSGASDENNGMKASGSSGKGDSG
jgi:putative flippase GtrA